MEPAEESSSPSVSGDDINNRTRRVDPLADGQNLSRVLACCESRRELRVVKLRAAYLTQREIAEQIEMSVGWTCETLAAIRSRCGWKNAVPVAKKRKLNAQRQQVK